MGIGKTYVSPIKERKKKIEKNRARANARKREKEREKSFPAALILQGKNPPII